MLNGISRKRTRGLEESARLVRLVVASAIISQLIDAFSSSFVAFDLVTYILNSYY